jgi:hypothetical protein
MKTMAILDENNKVLNIAVYSDDEPETLNLITYQPTNPAEIGGDYFENYFYSVQPFPSWTRDKGRWIPPTPRPQDGKDYTWDEDNLNWILVEEI